MWGYGSNFILSEHLEVLILYPYVCAKFFDHPVKIKNNEAQEGAPLNLVSRTLNRNDWTISTISATFKRFSLMINTDLSHRQITRQHQYVAKYPLTMTICSFFLPEFYG